MTGTTNTIARALTSTAAMLLIAFLLGAYICIGAVLIIITTYPQVAP